MIVERRHLLIAVWLALSTAAAAQEVQVTASVDAEEIGAADQLRLTVTVSGRDSGETEAPRLPDFAGFDVAGGPSVSTQFQWINGRTSASRSYTYVLLPKNPGRYTLGAIEVRAGGKVFKTDPIMVTVRAGTVRPSRPRTSDPFGDEGLIPRAARSGEEVMVEAEIDRKRAYPGQQVTLSYHLYTQVGVTGLQLQESPPLTGFWVEEIDVDKNPRAERKILNGREYLDYVVKRQALFPNSPGTHKIPPAAFAVSARTGGDFFGIFSQSDTLFRKSNELLLEVVPLPDERRPPAFGGTVGAFNLTASLGKSQAGTGEAVSLHIRLSGRGNLKMVPEITPPQLPDFTVYSSKQAANIRVLEGKWIGGEKTWEYVLVPKAPGDQSIPGIAFACFDPEKAAYETLTTPPLALRVVRGDDSGAAVTGLSGIDKQPLIRRGTDINFIKLSDSSLSEDYTPIYRSGWYYLLFALPVAGNIALYVYQRQRRKQLSDVALARSRKARRTALARLRSAVRLGREDPRRFYDEAAAALSGYLANKFNLPEIALASDLLERNLMEKGVKPDLISGAISCLQECDFGRFVGAAPSPAGARDFAVRIRSLIGRFEGD